MAFAEVEKFIDTPVKRYSSGMYVRLAFAVAAHLEPEILMVDEVLAVGDAAVQKKCLGQDGRCGDAKGRTVLFVSHNMTAVGNLCEDVIWLSSGRILEAGETGISSIVISKRPASPSPSNSGIISLMPQGNDKVRLHRASALLLDGSHSSVITIRSPFVIKFGTGILTHALGWI